MLFEIAGTQQVVREVLLGELKEGLARDANAVEHQKPAIVTDGDVGRATAHVDEHFHCGFGAYGAHRFRNRGALIHTLFIINVLLEWGAIAVIAHLLQSILDFVVVAVSIVFAKRERKCEHVAIGQTPLGKKHFRVGIKQRKFEEQRAPGFSLAVEIPFQIRMRFPDLVKVSLI